MCRRTWVAWACTSYPAIWADPASATARVVRMRTTVVLPAPFGPSRARMLPFSTDRSRPTRACTAPYLFTSPFASIIGRVVMMSPRSSYLPSGKLEPYQSPLPVVK